MFREDEILKDALKNKSDYIEAISNDLFQNNFDVECKISTYKVDYYVSEFKVLDGHTLEDNRDGEFKIDGYNITTNNNEKLHIIEECLVKNFKLITNKSDLDSMLFKITKTIEKEMNNVFIQDNKDCALPIVVIVNKHQMNNSFLITILDFSDYSEKFRIYSELEIFLECIEYLRFLSREVHLDALNQGNGIGYIRGAAFKNVCCILLEKKIMTFSEENRSAHELIDSFSEVASLSYENSDSGGSIILGADVNINSYITFQNNIKLNQTKYIRKLLEISRNDLNLIFKEGEIKGVGEIKNRHCKEGSYIIIEFMKKNFWQVIYKEDGEENPIILFDIDNGKPKRHRGIIEKSVFEEILLEKFKSNVEVEVLYNIITEASKQKKGTIIVIQEREKIKKELKRLGGRVTEIRHVKYLSNDMISALTSIDGAMIVDTMGFCHSIGVILDGTVPLKVNKEIELNNPERGSRYNSAMLYQYNNSKDTICISISEDGYINVIDNK